MIKILNNTTGEFEEHLPRICEVLGVKIGQRFVIADENKKYYVTAFGQVLDSRGSPMSGSLLCTIINNPSLVEIPNRLTDTEIATCKFLGARFVTMDAAEHTEFVKLWTGDPSHSIGDEDVKLIGLLHKSQFPSVDFGDCVCVPEEQ